MLKALLSEQDIEKLEKGLYSLSVGVTLEALIQKNLEGQLIYFKTKIADHKVATYGTAKYDLHQLLVAVIDAPDFSQLKAYLDADRNAQQKVAARMKEFKCKKILQLTLVARKVRSAMTSQTTYPS